ncbi:hypothetical protein [Microbacterium sp. G2-8]|uniref:hypothetical protein n=1 Tax=Microbacterium sp. G2-8 TaxID=2842454 RepID=UPI001C8A348D|nr:hypothetical protein [Microbacterium sp. G2-8]
MPLDIYAPVIHGIGVRDHEAFAEYSVQSLAAHLHASPSGWSSQPCPDPCEVFRPGHAHLADASGRSLVLDPLMWHAEMREPSRWRAAWWFLRTLFVLCAVHLLVNGQVVAEMPGARFRDFFLYLWRIVRAMTWMLVIGTLAIGLAIPLSIGVVIVPQLRHFVTDALGWTSDPETRFGVIELVAARVLEVGAQHTVLIGHSQGGAIATNASRVLDPNRTTLVTMGTGQALLAPVRASLGVPGASIVALVVAILTYVAAALVVMRALFVGVFEAIAGAVAAVRALRTDPTSVPDAVASAMFSPGALAALVCIPLIALAVIVYARVFSPAVEGVRDLCRPDLPGVDMCATFDLVSHPFTVLGDPSRVTKIVQSASLADHARYFANEIEVLTELDRQITHAGESDPAPVVVAARHRVRRAMRLHRVLRGTGSLVAAGAAFAWLASAPAAIIAGAAVYLAGTLLKSVRWSALQGSFAAGRGDV